jgi:hypothetical protein
MASPSAEVAMGVSPVDYAYFICLFLCAHLINKSRKCFADRRLRSRIFGEADIAAVTGRRIVVYWHAKQDVVR